MRAIACLAVAGAVPLTVGAILWVIASVMQGLASAHGWGGTAGVGEVLVLAGLVCGLAMIIMATRWQRGTPRPAAAGPAGRLEGNGQALMPLASPEQQAYPAGPAGMPLYPQPPAGYPQADPQMLPYPRPDPAYPEADLAYPPPPAAYPPAVDAQMLAYPQPEAPWAEPPGPQPWPPPPGQGSP
jgi:hypothetical protein